MKDYTKGFTVILLLFTLLLTLAGLVFFIYKLPTKKLTDTTVQQSLSPTPSISDTQDNASSWKTFISTDNSFQINYPSNLYKRLICPNEEFTAVVITNKEIPDKNPQFMSNCNRDSSYDFEVVKIESTPNYPSSNRYEIVTKRSIIIGDINALEFTISENIIENPTEDDQFAITVTPNWRKEVYINKNNKSYLIYFADENNKDILPQILSTFKFITTNPTYIPPITTKITEMTPEMACSIEPYYSNLPAKILSKTFISLIGCPPSSTRAIIVIFSAVTLIIILLVCVSIIRKKRK